jgi:transposase
MSLCRSLRYGARLTIPEQPQKPLCRRRFCTTLPVAVQFVVDTRSSIYDCAWVPISAPYSLTECRRFFAKPATARQRQYEALRAFYVDQLPSAEVARRFGYSAGAFRVLCHAFRHGDLQEFFSATRPGRRDHPKKSRAHDQIIALRKRNYSVYEISQALKEQGTSLSATAVREVLAAEGFAPLPRRLDEERPCRIGPQVQAVANINDFVLTPREFTTRMGGLFLFIPDLVKLECDALAQAAKLPGSRMIPAAHALRASLALKLWAIERKSHIMALVADEGLALFCGLNAMPKKSFLSEYSSRITPQKVAHLLARWHAQVSADLFTGASLNLDFHSVPYFGEHPLVESHYLAKRSRRQPSILVFLAQDPEAQAFCYANADIRKGEEADEIFRFIDFWRRQHGKAPQHLVFDSKLTTYAGLDRLDAAGITFLTLRRRSPALLTEIAGLPPSAWRTVELDVPHRKYRNPRFYEQKARPLQRVYRQFFIADLGHDEPTILLTNDAHATAKSLITRYAKRMLIENALADAVRFFHIDALSSSVGLKVDFDMALLVIASGLYRLMARRMRGYNDAQARQIFRDLIDMPADVAITDDEITLRFHRRAHLPIVLASGLFNKPVKVPWWNGRALRLLQ